MAVIYVPIEHSTPTPGLLLRGTAKDVKVHASNMLHHLLHSLLIDYLPSDAVVTLRCANEKHAALVRDALEREAATFAGAVVRRKGDLTSTVNNCDFRFVCPTRHYHARLLERDVPSPRRLSKR